MRSVSASAAQSAAGLALLSFVASAQSNWVDFVEETSTRLSLASVTLNDTQEKDLEPGDFDKDGDTDLIIVRKLPFTNAGPRTNVLLMNENGVLVERTSTLAPGFLIPDDARDSILFDANNDTWMDLVIANTFSEQPRLFLNQGNDGGGVWQGFVEDTNWLTSPLPGGLRFCAVAAGDVDGDGFQDLFFSDYGTADDRLVMNNGDGTFTDETNSRILTSFNVSSFGTQGFIVDLNGDDAPEILNASGFGDPPGVAYNDGTGLFPTNQTLNAQAAYQIGIGDLDNDEDIDVYVADDGQDYMFYNDAINGNQTVNWSNAVAVTQSFLTIGFNHHNHLIDIDKDGYLDIGNADVDVDIPGCFGQFSLLRNRLSDSPLRGFYDPNVSNVQPWNSFGNFDFAWIDIDGDGCEDMVHGTCTGYRVFMQVCDTAPGVPFCFGDGGDQLGCTDCPCGNDAAPGSGGGCVNGASQSAELTAAGEASVTLDSLSLSLQGGNPNTFAVLVSANNMLPNMGPCPPGSGVQGMPALDGLRCVGGGLLRHGSRAMDSSGDVGLTNNPWGPPGGPPAGILNSSGFVAGQVRQFQVFYRESDQLVCGTGQNTSNGVSVTVLP